jgi:hypothetical protein
VTLDLPREYVRLGLAFDRLERGFVDAWTGPAQVRAEVEERADAGAGAAGSPGSRAAHGAALGWPVARADRFPRSTDNLSRPEAELAPLLRIIEGVVTDLAGPDGRWTLRIVGRWTCCPPRPRGAQGGRRGTEGRPGRRGQRRGRLRRRREIADAVRSMLQAHAAEGAASRRSPSCSTSSTSPSTSTPAGSPTPTW